MATASKTRLALRVRLATGSWSIPLARVQHLAGYATLTGEPDDYFLGWLLFRGQQVPVFDLNRVVCDEPTEERFGSRIVLIARPGAGPAGYLGLLATGVTDTVAVGSADAPTLDLDSYLPMVLELIPPGDGNA